MKIHKVAFFVFKTSGAVWNIYNAHLLLYYYDDIGNIMKYFS